MKRKTVDVHVENFSLQSRSIQLVKNAVGSRDEVAALEGGGGSADYAVVSLHCLRVYL
jgi:IS5 family transposase